MSFLTSFFAEGNDLSLEGLDSNAKTALDPFLELFSLDLAFSFLPRLQAASRTTWWYVFCRTEAVRRSSRTILRAFIGNTYSNLSEMSKPLRPDDPVDRAVLDEFGENCFRFEVLGGQASRQQVTDRLRTLGQLLRDRPPRSVRRLRPVGRVLRDFEFAVRARDRSAMESCLEELQACGYVSATNLNYLELRRSVAEGHYAAALEPGQLEGIVSLGPPRAVVDSLLQAVYMAELAAFEEGLAAAEAIEHFRQVVAVKYAPLLRSRAGLVSGEALACFVIDAAASSPSRPKVATAILERLPATDPRRPFLSEVAKFASECSVSSPGATLASARESFVVGNLDDAFRLAAELENSYDRVALLLRCARDMALDEARFALAAAERLSVEEQDRLGSEPILRRILVQLRSLLGNRGTVSEDPGPTDWVDWIERVNGTEEWPGALKAAELGAAEWDLEACLSGVDAVGRLVDLIGHGRNAWGDRVFRDAVPHLVGALTAIGARASLRPVYQALFLQMATDPDASIPQWVEMGRLFVGQLELGLGEKAYGEHAAALTSLFVPLHAPRLLPEAVELLECLIDFPCPNPAARERFAEAVHAEFVAFRNRAPGHLQRSLNNLVTDLGLRELALPSLPGKEEGSDAGDFWARVRGKVVALYSLRTQALRRAREALEDLCPQARVVCFSDSTGGDPRLRAAARNADLFVVATAAAKHAATDFIEAERPEGRPIVAVHAQGSTRLLGAVHDYAAQYWA